MPLRSDLFKDDEKLKAILRDPHAHLIVKTPPIRGDHVAKVQQALTMLQPSSHISETEMIAEEYGRSTADAVQAYKRQRHIINSSYQQTADDIVGTMTIQSMDDDLFGKSQPRSEVMDRAFNDSRAAIQTALRILRKLKSDIDDAMAAGDDTVRLNAVIQIQMNNQRNIEVLARRLVLPLDVTSTEFRDALGKLIPLLERNLAMPKSLFAAGLTGVCSPTFPDNIAIGGVPFARTGATLTPGKTHLCDPFFSSNRFQQREVITHELFHLFGSAFTDHAVANATQGLSNPNTLAQIVARLNDRFRQANADGRQPDLPPLPMP